LTGSEEMVTGSVSAAKMNFISIMIIIHTRIRILPIIIVRKMNAITASTGKTNI
jgi:hypothetical protein